MDIQITEQNNGGDMTLYNNDLAIVYGVENMPYLSMFAGDDFWGNNLLLGEKFRSYLAETEKTLLTVALNSQGRETIIQAVKRDLQFLLEMNNNTTLDVQAVITNDNRLEMSITFNGQTISLLWNPITGKLVNPSHITPVCPVVAGLSLTATTDSITATWTTISGVTYQYGYNTTNVTPTSWTAVSGGFVTISGLVDSTEYYVFVRTVCVGSYSLPVSDSISTDIAIPAPPITTGLIMSLFSSYGYGARWIDLSSAGNDLYPTTTTPALVPNIFGVRPAVRFNLDVLETLGAMSGMSGNAACTVFLVAKFPDPTSTHHMLYYTGSPTSILAGQFEVYTQKPLSTPQLGVVMRGNVGFNSGAMDTVADGKFIYTFDMDFSKTLAAELKVYKDNSMTGYTTGATSNNTGVFTNAPFGVGTGNQDVGCILVYNTSLSNTDRTTIYNYLQTYFSI
jgi:phage gp46-like protein